MLASPTILFSATSPESHPFCLQLLKESAATDIYTCSNSEEISNTLQTQEIHIIFLDSTLYPESEYMTNLDAIQTEYPELLVIAAIPDDNPALEQEILNRDTFFYISTPYQDSEVQLALKRALAKLNIQPSAPVTTAKKRLPPFYGIIGETRVMQNLFNLIAKVAEDDIATVLIRGDSGTGKELVAKAIHSHSTRKSHNFVPVNCAAIPDDLLESELFGYTKGAFTGAAQNKIGRIEYADGGTLFLDEIGDMKPTLQAKLLRVLQEREFEPVGALKATPVDTRIVAATHCDLEQLVADGQFREDLYYRLSVIPLSIPSLNDRKEDIPILLDAFLELHGTKRGREKFTIPMNVMVALLSYDWKGNVRELENLVQHMSILCSGKVIQLEDLLERILVDFDPADVDLDHITNLLSNSSLSDESSEENSQESRVTVPVGLGWHDGQVDFKELINDYESQLIIKAMKMTKGNKKEAAKLLNLKRTTLLEKLRKKTYRECGRKHK